MNNLESGKCMNLAPNSIFLKDPSNASSKMPRAYSSYLDLVPLSPRLEHEQAKLLRLRSWMDERDQGRKNVAVRLREYSIDRS